MYKSVGEEDTRSQVWKNTRKSIKESAFPEGGVVSREARSADAGSSEKPHGGVSRGWANGGTQNERAEDQRTKKRKQGV